MNVENQYYTLNHLETKIGDAVFVKEKKVVLQGSLSLNPLFVIAINNEVPYEQWKPGKALPPLNFPELRSKKGVSEIDVKNFLTPIYAKEIIFPNWSKETSINSCYAMFIATSSIKKIDCSAWDNDCFVKYPDNRYFFRSDNLEVLDVNGITDPEIAKMLFKECRLPNLKHIFVANEQIAAIVKTALHLGQDRGFLTFEMYDKICREAKKSKDEKTSMLLRKCAQQHRTFLGDNVFALYGEFPEEFTLKYLPEHSAKIHVTGKV